MPRRGITLADGVLIHGADVARASDQPAPPSAKCLHARHYTPHAKTPAKRVFLHYQTPCHLGILPREAKGVRRAAKPEQPSPFTAHQPFTQDSCPPTRH